MSFLFSGSFDRQAKTIAQERSGGFGFGQKIERAEEYAKGEIYMLVLDRFSFKNDVDEMSSTKMQYLFAITKRMHLCIDEAIQSATSK